MLRNTMQCTSLCIWECSCELQSSYNFARSVLQRAHLQWSKGMEAPWRYINMSSPSLRAPNTSHLAQLLFLYFSNFDCLFSYFNISKKIIWARHPCGLPTLLTLRTQYFYIYFIFSENKHLVLFKLPPVRAKPKTYETKNQNLKAGDAKLES